MLTHGKNCSTVLDRKDSFAPIKALVLAVIVPKTKSTAEVLLG